MRFLSQNMKYQKESVVQYVVEKFVFAPKSSATTS